MIELSVQGLRAGYGAVEVLHGVDLAVPRGALTALLGPNGAGKTTLLSVVGGLHPLRAGRVVWGDVDISRTAPDARARGGMTLIPERRGIFPDLTVRENLEVFVGEDGDSDVALAAFPVLADRMTQRAGSLSGGEQQMLAMSRALLKNPRLLLLDEISFGLAPRVTRRLFDVVAELARGGTTVILVEQYLSDALRLADVVYVLARGEVVFAGEPGELIGRSLPGYVTGHQEAGHQEAGHQEAGHQEAGRHVAG
jgi:branched-chain amino acid transport system ATP-binding protein